MTQDERDLAVDPPSPPEDQPRRERHHLPVWQESLLLLAIALVLAIVLKAFFVQAFYIPSESMEPGLVKNDRILVEKPSYWAGGTPQRGDVIVFADPGDWLGPDESAGPTNALQKGLEKVGLYPSGGHLVKRVIGVAGDTVVCCDKQGRIEVNGQPLTEPYLKNAAACNGPMVSQCGKGWTAGPVPAGDLFVMGDHRDRSADSSYHLCAARSSAAAGCVESDAYVPVDLVVGKVVAKVWPFDHLGLLHRPATFADIPDGG